MIDLNHCNNVCNTDPNDLSINDVRECIDMIDEGMAHLIEYRLKLTKKMGDVKQSHSDDRELVLRPSREAKLLRKWMTHFKGQLHPLAVQSIWRALISSGCLSEQNLTLLIPNEAQSVNEVEHYFGRFFPSQAYEDLDAAIHQVMVDKHKILIINSTQLLDSHIPKLIQSYTHYGIKCFLKLPVSGSDIKDPLLCFGYLPLEPSGHDQSVILLNSTENESLNLFVKDRLNESVQVLWQSKRNCLIQTDGFIESSESMIDDKRFANLPSTINRYVLGVFPSLLEPES